MIENWHRLNLDSLEAERFIYKLWEDGRKSGRYKSIADMARKLGLKEWTLRTIIRAYEDREKLFKDENNSRELLSYTDFRETEILKDETELRKQVLDLRAKDKITRDELRQFSKIIKENPEMAEYAIKLKEEGKSVQEIEQSIEDLFDWLEIIRKLKEQGKTQKEIAEVLGWSRSKVADYNRILENVVAEVLEYAKQHQKDRVTQNVANATFDFNEGWFRNSGIYNLPVVYDDEGNVIRNRQMEFMKWFIEKKKCRTNMQTIKKQVEMLII